MNRLLDFIRKTYLALIFVILEVIAFNMYQGGSIYVSGETHNSSNKIMGSIYTIMRDFEDYLSLKKTNREILDRNAQLMERLAWMENLNMRLIRGDVLDTLPFDNSLSASLIIDTLVIGHDSSAIIVAAHEIRKDRYINARVENNTVMGQRNFITLDRGSLDSVRIDLPVVCDDAIVGYIVAVDRNYSIAISVLSVDFKTSGMLKNDGSLCSIFWKGENFEEVDFSGISRYANIQKGDTIMTTGFSSFFTSDKMIGVVKDYSLVDDMYYNGKIELLTPFYKLKNVQIIFPDNLNERLNLEKKVNNSKAK